LSVDELPDDDPLVEAMARLAEEDDDKTDDET
jgi:hypothetical protein